MALKLKAIKIETVHSKNLTSFTLNDTNRQGHMSISYQPNQVNTSFFKKLKGKLGSEKCIKEILNILKCNFCSRSVRNMKTYFSSKK